MKNRVMHATISIRWMCVMSIVWCVSYCFYVVLSLSISIKACYGLQLKSGLWDILINFNFINVIAWALSDWKGSRDFKNPFYFGYNYNMVLPELLEDIYISLQAFRRPCSTAQWIAFFSHVVCILFTTKLFWLVSVWSQDQ